MLTNTQIFYLIFCILALLHKYYFIINLQGYNCADLYEKGLTEDGIYYLQIGGTRFWYLKVFCEMQRNSGGWTVSSRDRSDSECEITIKGS